MVINRSINLSVPQKKFFSLDIPLSFPFALHLQSPLPNMSNDDRIRCADPQCTNTYGCKFSMRKHYIAKHTEEATKLNEETFPCRSPDCEKILNRKDYRVEHERKFHQPALPLRNKSDHCSRSIKGTENWKLHLKNHKNNLPHPCPEPDCDKGYTDARSLRVHREAAHTGNNQPHLNPRPPSKTIDVVPQPEPVLNEETKQPMPNG